MILTFTYGDPTGSTRDAIGRDLHAMLALAPTTFFVDQFNGIGEWTDTDFKTYTEHSGVIVADYPFVEDLWAIRQKVADIARRYRQDAIGCIVADADEPSLVAS
jgi:hypothetical protein